jgi:hypothetical protein
MPEEKFCLRSSRRLLETINDYMALLYVSQKKAFQMKGMPLKDSANLVANFYVKYRDEKGYWPTPKEVSEKTNISISRAKKMLVYFESRGIFQRIHGKRGAIEIGKNFKKEIENER